MDIFLRVKKTILEEVIITRRKRRNYSNEFKEEAGKLVTDQDYSVAEVSHDLGVKYSRLVLERRSQSKLITNQHRLEAWWQDVHRFSRTIGFVTTFCKFEKHSVFDIATGQSKSELLIFLKTL